MKSVDKYLVFTFGVIFISVLLWLVFRKEAPLTADEARIVHLVSALAAAGVGAALPGTLHVQYRPLLRAGGALALFVLVFVYQPQRAVTPETVWPSVTSDPEMAITRHLELTDAGSFETAYLELSPEAKKRFTKKEFISSFENARNAYGKVKSRTRMGVTGMISLPDGTKGTFKWYGHVTHFESGKIAQEPIVAMLTGNENWGVLFHNLVPCPMEGCFPTPPTSPATSSSPP